MRPDAVRRRAGQPWLGGTRWRLTLGRSALPLGAPLAGQRRLAACGGVRRRQARRGLAGPRGYQSVGRPALGLAALLAGRVWLAALHSPAAADAGLPAEALVQVDSTRVTLGDPVHVRLEVRFDPADRPLLAEIDPAAWFGAVSCRPGPVQRAPALQGRQVLAQTFELRFYELGAQRVPGTRVRFALASGDTLTRQTEPFQVQVLPVRDTADRELRQVKPPVIIAGGWPVWWVLVLLAVVVAAVAVWWFRRRRPAAPAPVAAPRPPTDYAAEFVRIAGLGLVEKGEFKEYYSLLADNLRRFIEERLSVPAMESTTGEACQGLRTAHVESTLVDQVNEFLASADLVKFARGLPAVERARRAPEAGIALVLALERHRAAMAAAAAQRAAAVAAMPEAPDVATATSAPAPAAALPSPSPEESGSTP